MQILLQTALRLGWPRSKPLNSGDSVGWFIVRDEEALG